MSRSRPDRPHAYDLGALSWPDVEPSRLLLAVALGSCEQHGPHLPLDTDARIAAALATELAERRDDVVVAPTLAFGSSGEHAGFPGTLSIGQAALELLIVELCRSAGGFAGVVLVNGHGGNAEPVTRAVSTLTGEGRSVLPWWPVVAGGDAHAGRTETSLLLAIAPAAVRLDEAEPGVTAPLAELLPALRRDGLRSVTANGVLGDPTGASATEGERLLAVLGDDLAAAVAAWTEP